MKQDFENISFYLHNKCSNSLVLHLNFYDPELIDFTYNPENKEVIISSKETIDLFEIAKSKIIEVSSCECVKYFFNLNLKNLKCKKLKVNFDVGEDFFPSKFDTGINDRFLYVNTFPEECKFLDLEVSSLYDFYSINNKYLREFQIVNNFFDCFNESLLKIKDKQILLKEDISFHKVLRELQNNNLLDGSLITLEGGEFIYVAFIYFFLKYNFKVSFLKMWSNYEYYNFKTLDKFVDKIYGIPIDKFVYKLDEVRKLNSKYSIEF